MKMIFNHQELLIITEMMNRGILIFAMTHIRTHARTHKRYKFDWTSF